MLCVCESAPRVAGASELQSRYTKPTDDARAIPAANCCTRILVDWNPEITDGVRHSYLDR